MTSEPAVVAPDAARVEVAQRRQHPAYLVISTGQIIRALIPLIAIGIWKAPWWAIAVLGVLIAAMAVVSWLTSTYSVTNGDLQVRSGLLARKTQTIPVRRITAVDAKRGVIQRLLGVWGLKVQTPGDGDRASVSLHSLSHRQLEQLLSALRPQGHIDDGAPAATASNVPIPAAWRMPGEHGGVATSGQVVARLDTRTLLVAAVTGTSVPILLAGAAAAWSRLHDILPRRYGQYVEERLFDRSVTFLLAAGAVLLVLAVVVGIALTSLRLAQFTLIRDGERLRVNRGLISQRSGTIAVDRVQAVRLVEGLWRRLLGYCALEVEVAGVGRNDTNDRMLFPLVRRDRAHALVSRALPELGWRDAPLRRLDAQVRRRYLTRPVLAALVPTLATPFLPGWWAALAVVWLPVGIVIGWLQGRDAAWSLDPDTVVIRSRRVLARHTVVARTRRVQITRTTQTPFQRRSGLAGLTLSLSSSRFASLRQLEDADAALLLHVVGRRGMPR